MRAGLRLLLRQEEAGLVTAGGACHREFDPAGKIVLPRAGQGLHFVRSDGPAASHFHRWKVQAGL